MEKRGFTSYECPDKYIARVKIITHALNILGRKPINALTLPAANFIFEDLCMDMFPDIKFMCAERDIKVFREGRRNIPKGRIIYSNKDIFELAGKTKDKYNLVWLDFCSFYNDSILSGLFKLIERESEDDCILAITLQKSREPGMDVVMKASGAKTLKEFRNSEFPNILRRYSTLSGKSLEVLEVYEYKDRTRISTPMILLIFNLKRENHEGNKEKKSVRKQMVRL